MEFQIVPTYGELCEQVAEEICGIADANRGANLCIAAGHSSLGVFDALVHAAEQGRVDFSQCSFTAMDEWLGMNRATPGSCGDFLCRHFLSRTCFKAENISLVDGRAQPIEPELERMRRFIEDRGGIDCMVLGMGMNGHLALNEPGSGFDSGIRVTRLDALTQRVGTKYFENAPVLMGGVTLGLSDICRTRRLILVVNGTNKAEIVRRFRNSPPTEELPATVLKTAENCTVYVDKEAAALL